MYSFRHLVKSDDGNIHFIFTRMWTLDGEKVFVTSAPRPNNIITFDMKPTINGKWKIVTAVPQWLQVMENEFSEVIMEKFFKELQNIFYSDKLLNINYIHNQFNHIDEFAGI